MSEVEVHAAWARVGGGLSVPPRRKRVDMEDLLVRTLSHARSDARLFWVAASWVSVHHNLVNTRRLVGRLKRCGELEKAVAGALFSVAKHEVGSVTLLNSVLKHCAPIAPPRPLFTVIEKNAVLTYRAREAALPLFREWGFWQDNISMRTDATRPIRWVLAHCPEFHTRAILGATLEAEIIDLVAVVPSSVQDVSTICEVAYSAAHEAASRLIARGWLSRSAQNGHQLLAMQEEFQRWYDRFPHRVAAENRAPSPLEARRPATV